ncbi:MAG TPA: extracellular solute-binding protein [Candidatus Limnocylindrales bacterium]|nr:extracellular solute-binding protein [Candidatus Limnocylindrales bacterium]
MKVIVGVLILSLSIACNGWAQGKMTTEQLAAYNKPDREKVLYAGAKGEGKITWYTSLAGESYKKLAAAFEAKYPGVAVESYRATRQEMSARIMAESQAQRYIADTMETTIPLLKLLKDNNLLVPYYFPTQAKYPDQVKEKAAKGLVFWAIDRESHIGLAYNKNMIPAQLAPKNYEGLLRPELKDKIAFAGSDTGVTVTGAMLKFKGEEYVRKLKSLSPAVHNVSGRALLDMVISGEVGVSPSTFRNHVEVSLKAGAPIAWIPMDVVPSNSGSTAVLAKAPHPHGALLLADFILGAGGQKVLEEYEYGNPSKEYGFKRWYPEQGLTAEQIDKLEEKWRLTMRDLTRRSSF